MDLLIRIIIGGVIGWLGSIIMKTDAQMGLIANVIVGIVGAALGGWIGAQMGVGGGPLMPWIFSVLGAVVLIFILKAVGVFK